MFTTRSMLESRMRDRVFQINETKAKLKLLKSLQKKDRNYLERIKAEDDDKHE